MPEPKLVVGPGWNRSQIGGRCRSTSESQHLCFHAMQSSVGNPLRRHLALELCLPLPARERLLREFPILHASAPMSSPGDAASVVVNAGDSGAGDAAGVVVNAGDAGAAPAVTPYISNRHRGTIGPAHLV